MDSCLNPFFIRSQLLQYDMKKELTQAYRLNPFFIRSQLLHYVPDPMLGRVGVLIPSSSGLSYYSTPCFSRYRS